MKIQFVSASLVLCATAVFSVPAAVPSGSSAASLYEAFRRPSHAVKPWSYWLWENTHIDRDTIVKDVAAIRDLGFGAVLMSDSRGYWDDERHVKKPPQLHVWGSDSWLDLVAEAIRECHRQGIGFSMNVAASGGKLNGEVLTGNDAPKVLIVKRCRPGEKVSMPDTPYCGSVATFAVRTTDRVKPTGWLNAGDGFYTMSATSGRRADGQEAAERYAALEVKELSAQDDGASLGAGWTVLRFAWRDVPKHEKDVDVLDPKAVRRHLDRVLLPLFERIPGLYGKDKTFTHIYSVSWEGAMPTWSPSFEADFARFAGRPLRPLLPVLAGFDISGEPTEKVFRDFRRARGDMMRKNFYTTMREYAHERGMHCYAESGGPWIRRPQVFGECDQMGFLSEMDIPQGEFWPVSENRASDDAGHANKNLRTLSRGAVSTAHVYGKRIISIEAFTHMHRHWSADPQYLKPLADQVFADGVNRIVWHTYTCSPERFGVPGLEYFAGTHINRNVTWHRELPPFVNYMARCQALLQEGEPVTDIAVLVGDRAYAHWGRWRDRVSNETPLSVPEGFAFDAVNDEALAKFPDLLKRYRIVHDARDPKNLNRTIPTGSLLPDAYGPFTWCHRRNASADWYFVAGDGAFDAIFRCTSAQPEVWNAVTGERVLADAERLPDGRTKVSLALPKAGSCFVVFPKTPEKGVPEPLHPHGEPLQVKGPWDVSFAYHPGISATPPPARKMEKLVDFRTVEDLKHFSGTATYRSSFVLDKKEVGTFYQVWPALFMTGVCRVVLNGVDCGVVWCDPWCIDVTGAIRPGANELEIRYVNNWYNRLVGDCALPPEKRVTKSALRYWDVPRTRHADGSFSVTPTVFSGYSKADPLQPCGLVGNVFVRAFRHGKPLEMVPDGTWGVKVTYSGGKTETFSVPPPERVAVKKEKHRRLPPKGGKLWGRECKFNAVRADECMVTYAVDMDSVVITTADGRVLKPGTDYVVDPKWGGIEREEGSSVAPKEPIWIDYVYMTRRIDSIVRTADGKTEYRKGVPHVANPEPPDLAPGEMRLGNVFTDAETKRISKRNLYPVLSAGPPVTAAGGSARKFLPKTWGKLERGEKVKILAWGDSVTFGRYLAEEDKWQRQFVRRLRKRFPKAEIELVSNGWGGRRSDDFLKAPPGDIHNYDEKVLGVKADLVISEFVNDCGGGDMRVRKFYPKYLEDFRKAGTEWIILTPHYVRLDWMGLKDCRETDYDPRPYVKAVRKFAEDNGIALADASLRWGHLWREGIPFSTLFFNDINHPVPRAMTFFADALMALFAAE